VDHLRRVFCCLCVSLLAACGGGGGSSAPSVAPPVVVTVTVTPATSSVALNRQVQLTATITGATTGPVTWSSSDTAVATVDPTGLVNALTVGQATITATIDGQSGTALVTTTMGLVFFSVSAGRNHTCALTPDGVAYCWGDNSYGQLGNGTTTYSTTPVPVSGGYDWSAISAGATHTCGIVGITVYCWGNNSSGQLGNGTTTNSLTPVPATPSSRLVFYGVSAGGSHTCGIVMPTFNVSLANVGYCWGENSSGQLGNGTINNSLIPVAVSTTLVDGSNSAARGGWNTLSAGYSHTCGNAVIPTAGGTPGNYPYGNYVLCWGDNSAGELGNGTTSNSDLPSFVVGTNISTYAAYANPSAASSYSCTVGSCWGSNSSGQLGNGSMTNSSFPVIITAPNNPQGYFLISAGGDHACAVTFYVAPGTPGVGAEAFCWGGNGSGQLGNGTMTNSATPVVVLGGLSFLAMSAGGSHTCGVTLVNSPVPVPGGSGAVYCWGDNTYGQLGNGTTTNSTTPVTASVTAYP
jgi:alpha-tubulin suppressor-like RCC1 family protein